ncbi:MAG: hypothetical protein HZA63_15120 [Rhodocyclales bacterium]|nr:hypothetical protein [Rhodocyclales bacterium]
MKRVVLGLVSLALSTAVFGADNRYEIKTSPYGSSSGGSTDIEMRRKGDYDPSNKFRGEIENDGSVRMRNSNGERLRGEIDSDGYGKLRDQDGNAYRVKPR